MEPVTHMLTGACLGRSGFNRKTAYGTLAMVLAAEAPDLDMVSGFWGPVTELRHHRGITHTFLGAPVMALFITGVVWGFAAISRRLGRRPPARPVRWGWIWLLALVADGSHILLDFTNSYGIRPFFPFDAHWHAWSIEFIFDPVMFAALLLGLAVPALLGLVEGEMRRRQPGVLRGRGWAIAALVGVGLLYGLRNAEHGRAEALMQADAMQANAESPLPRVTALPSMADPFRWHMLGETRDAYRTGEANTLAGTYAAGRQVGKPVVTSAVAAAKQSFLGRVYGDWSSWPVVEDVGAMAPPGDLDPLPTGMRTVAFHDLRFTPEALGRSGSSTSGGALRGWVVVDAHGRVVGEWMAGKEQPR